MPEKGTSGLMSGEGKRVGMQSGVGSAPFLDSTCERGDPLPPRERRHGIAVHETIIGVGVVYKSEVVGPIEVRKAHEGGVDEQSSGAKTIGYCVVVEALVVATLGQH